MNLREVISAQSANYDSFYLYDERCIIEYTERLKQHFPQVDFLYSVKCNANPHVVRSVFSQGFGADAASLGEVLIASGAGLSKDNIYYSAPGKTSYDLEQAVGKSTIIADSIEELKRLQAIAVKLDTRIDIGVRLNPDFSFCGSGGQPSKFGVDEKQLYEFLAENTLRNIKITGIHVHLKSQELDAGVLAGYYENMIRLAERFQIVNRYEFVTSVEIQTTGKDIRTRQSFERELRTIRTSTNRFYVRFHANGCLFYTSRCV